jgi:hypothetical protein
MKADYARIPPATLRRLRKWIAVGVQLDDDDDADSFVMAVLSNDLSAAVSRADPPNLAALPAILDWLQHHGPRGSYGSPSALGVWPKLARMHAGSRI